MGAVTATEPATPHQTALALEFKRLFETSGLSLRKIADLVGYSHGSLSKSASGKTMPPEDISVIIAERLDGNVAEMTRLWAAANAEKRALGGDPAEVTETEGREQLRVVATALQAECRRRKLTVRDIAKKSGYSKSTVNDLFHGVRYAPESPVLTDVLQSIGMTSAEQRTWSNRFSRAAEAIRSAQKTDAASDSSVAELTTALEQLRRHVMWLTGIGGAALTVLLLVGLIKFIQWTEDDNSYSASLLRETTSYTKSTSGTPLPPGAILGSPNISTGGYGSKISVFESPSIDSKKTALIQQYDTFQLVCQVVTDTAVIDKDATTMDSVRAKTWVKISLNNTEIGYVPKIYVTIDTNVVPVLDPPPCP